MGNVPGLKPLSLALALVVSAVTPAPAAAAADAPASLVSRALAARDARDAPAAIRLLEEAVAKDPRPEWMGLLAETLAWEKQFARAEGLYRAALAKAPLSRDLALGLGRVLLWQGRYPEARGVLGGLVARAPGDADALEELALAAYWSGDWRAAEKEFRQVLVLRPASAVARKSLDEIAAASRARWDAGVAALTDDQPFRAYGLTAKVSLFSDPLTRWDVSGGGQELRAPDGAPSSGSSPWVRVGVEAGVPSLRLTLAGGLEALRAPDATTLALFDVSATRRFGPGASLKVFADRRALLATRSSLADHANVTRAGASFRWESASHAAAGADASYLSYFDGNRGVAASGWLLFPVVSARGFRLSLGPALSYRDTDETRFEPVSAAATPDPAGFTRYAWTGAYVPYWTPQRLEEARVAAVLEGPLGAGVTLRLSGDAGWARDEATGFGPDSGASPVPPSPYSFQYDRTFHPWRAAASLAVALGASGTRLTLGWEHETTVYYRSDAFHAGLVGRF